MILVRQDVASASHTSLVVTIILIKLHEFQATNVWCAKTPDHCLMLFDLPAS